MYYLDDELDKNWCILVHVKPRDLYNMGGDDVDNFHQSKPLNNKTGGAPKMCEELHGAAENG